MSTPATTDTSSSVSILPAWARVSDAVTVLLVLLAASVLLFGGFRISVPVGRLSVTDWVRPVIAALLLTAVRHYFVRVPSIHRRLLRGVSRWWRSPDTRAVLPIYLATRLGVLAVGFLAVVMIGYPAGFRLPSEIYQNAFLDLPMRWDTGWYLSIVNDGYQWSPERSQRIQQNITFFPAYPMLIRGLSVFFGRHQIWTGVFISLGAFFWASIYLLRLAREHLQDEERAATAVLLIASYPFALFFSAAYTESLFLLALVASFYHFRRDELWRAGAWGLLAGLTRPNGAFISVALGLMVLERWWADWRAAREGGPPMVWSRHMDRLASASASGFGMLFYSTYILFLTGDPFQWTKEQVAWGRVYRGLDTIVTDRLEFVNQWGFYAYASTQSMDMLYFIAVTFMLVAAWPVYRRFGAPYAVLILINVLAPMAAGGLLSMGRVTSILFPAFLWMAAVIPPSQRGAWVALFALLQGFGAIMFFTWRPLY